MNTVGLLDRAAERGRRVHARTGVLRGRRRRRHAPAVLFRPARRADRRGCQAPRRDHSRGGAAARARAPATGSPPCRWSSSMLKDASRGENAGMNFETLVARGGRDVASASRPLTAPIYQTNVYVFEDMDTVESVWEHKTARIRLRALRDRQPHDARRSRGGARGRRGGGGVRVGHGGDDRAPLRTLRAGRSRRRRAGPLRHDGRLPGGTRAGGSASRPISSMRRMPRESWRRSATIRGRSSSRPSRIRSCAWSICPPSPASSAGAASS